MTINGNVPPDKRVQLPGIAAFTSLDDNPRAPPPASDRPSQHHYYKKEAEATAARPAAPRTNFHRPTHPAVSNNASPYEPLQDAPLPAHQPLHTSSPLHGMPHVNYSGNSIPQPLSIPVFQSPYVDTYSTAPYQTQATYYPNNSYHPGGPRQTPDPCYRSAPITQKPYPTQLPTYLPAQNRASLTIRSKGPSQSALQSSSPIKRETNGIREGGHSSPAKALGFPAGMEPLDEESRRKQEIYRKKGEAAKLKRMLRHKANTTPNENDVGLPATPVTIPASPTHYDDGIPRLTAADIRLLAVLAEPERSSQWLRMCFEKFTNYEVSQVHIWQAYERALVEIFPDQRHSGARELLDNVIKVFPTAEHRLTIGNGQPYYTVTGIRPRTMGVLGLSGTKDFDPHGTKREPAMLGPTDMASHQPVKRRQTNRRLEREAAEAAARAEEEAAAAEAAARAHLARQQAPTDWDEFPQPIVTEYDNYKWSIKLYKVVSYPTFQPGEIPSVCESAQDWVESLMPLLCAEYAYQWKPHLTDGFIAGGDLTSLVVLRNAINPFDTPISSSTTFGFCQFTPDNISWRTVTPDVVPTILDLAIKEGWITEVQKWRVDMTQKEKRFHRAYWLAANERDLHGLMNRADDDPSRKAVETKLECRAAQLLAESDMHDYVAEDWESGNEGIEIDDFDAQYQWDLCVEEVEASGYYPWE